MDPPSQSLRRGRPRMKKKTSTADESAAASLPPSSLVPGTMADKMARQAADLRDNRGGNLIADRRRPAAAGLCRSRKNARNAKRRRKKISHEADYARSPPLAGSDKLATSDKLVIGHETSAHVLSVKKIAFCFHRVRLPRSSHGPTTMEDKSRLY